MEDTVNLSQLKQAAFATSPGQLAHSLVPTSDGVMVLYVKAKLPVDVAKMQADLPNFVTSLRRTRQQEAFDDWLRKEMEKGLRDIPIFSQPRQPPVMGTAAKS